MIGIYKILNKNNHKVYIGSSKNLDKRLYLHKHTLKKGTHYNTHLQNAYIKYGVNDFSFEIIEIVNDLDKLIEREQFWIDFYNASNPDTGYNIRKIADSNLGVKRSEEFKLNLSKIHKGVKRPYIGESNKINKQALGSKRTEETKKALRECSKKANTPRMKKVYSINIETSEIKIYNYIRETKLYGFCPPVISRILNNKVKTKIHKGFIWLTQEEYENSLLL